jgi:hypothetical protein
MRGWRNASSFCGACHTGTGTVMLCVVPRAWQFVLPEARNMAEGYLKSVWRRMVRSNWTMRAVPWLRRLVAGLSPRRSGLILGQSMWDLWWTKWHWDRFLPEYFGFPLSISFHRWSISWKNEKLIIFLTIFIAGLHNEPQGCGASVASTAGPFTPKKKQDNEASNWRGASR